MQPYGLKVSPPIAGFSPRESYWVSQNKAFIGKAEFGGNFFLQMKEAFLNSALRPCAYLKQIYAVSISEKAGEFKKLQDRSHQ